jgi:hypothetical protein
MFQTHSLTLKLLKDAKSNAKYQPEFQHVAHYPNGGLAVTDKYRIFWTGDITGTATIPTAPDLKFPPNLINIIPTEFDYFIQLLFYKSDKKSFKAFLEVAKVNDLNSCNVEIGIGWLFFKIKTASGRIESETTFKIPVNTSKINVDRMSKEEMDNMNFNINLEFLTDLFFNFEFNSAGYNSFDMHIKRQCDTIKYIVFKNEEYNYLVSLLK